MKERTSPLGVERVYRDEHVRLLRALYAFARSTDVAEEAMAEAFAQLVQRGDAVADARAWVWKTAFLLAGREQGRRRSFTDQVQERSYEMTEPAADLVRALATLTPMQRGSIVLHYYGGYPAKEIAPMLGSTAPAVKVHLSVGRRRLRAILENDDE